MSDTSEQLLFSNAAYSLTSDGLQQEGLTARLEGGNKLIITRGEEQRELTIPPPPQGYTGMRSSIPVLTAMYNLAVHELCSNILPNGLLRAGATWNSVWTRDIAYAATLGAALLAPAEVQRSLESRVKNGTILQDTGTGGGWPISTDRVVWALGAWSLYESCGDLKWLNYCCDVLQATLAQDDRTLSANSPLRPGETSFLDWRDQSYPDWMTPADIGACYAFSTNILHYMANNILARMLTELDREKEALTYRQRAAELSQAIEQNFWNKANSQYCMLRTPDGCPDERTDALANALAVISGLAGEHASRTMSALPRSLWGTPVFSPYKSEQLVSYHNRAIWPFVESFVLLAQADLRDTEGAAFSMSSLLRAALAHGSCKENLHAVTGEASGTIQNSDSQLWSVAGMLGLFYYGMFGIHYESDNLVFTPCVPRSFNGTHWLTNLHIRDMVLNVRLNGYGTDIWSVRINGKPATPILPLSTKGNLQIEIELMPDESEESPTDMPCACEDLPEPEWDSPTPTLLRWHPVPGATSYYIFANGRALGATPECTFAPSRPTPGCVEYRVQAISSSNAGSLSRPWLYCPADCRTLLHPQTIGEQTEYPVEDRQAWLDTRPCTNLLSYGSTQLTAGTYQLQISYCNATGSLRDGDTCALRELLVDGSPVAVIPLPHNTEADIWDDYTLTAPITITLDEGEHSFALRYNPATCTNSHGDLNQCMVRTLELIRRS